MSTEDTDASRRLEELEALQAFYGDDVETVDRESPAKGPWKVRIAPRVVLEISFPKTYPSLAAPKPQIHAPPYVLDQTLISNLEQEMLELWQEDTDVAILWAEHLRAALDDHVEDPQVPEEVPPDTNEDIQEPDGTQTFIPATAKFGQPIRHFQTSVVGDEANRRTIHRTDPFHPPKSGPSETMVAHVASVQSMNHVNWVLAEVLSDKKVARATHNMIAYRFWDVDRGCLVSDNDDDGEKGSGTKLAALLEMSDARDVMVVVSRWYGGIHLGPSRFKYIASTARDGLLQAGFMPAKKGG